MNAAEKRNLRWMTDNKLKVQIKNENIRYK